MGRFHELWGRFCDLRDLGGDFGFQEGDFCRLKHTSELQVAVKFGAVNFRCELSHIPPTYVLSLAKLP